MSRNSATQQKVAAWDWIPAAWRSLLQVLKRNENAFTEDFLFLFFFCKLNRLNTHLLLKSLSSTVFTNEAKNKNKNKNHLLKMNAGWTSGHYPPCKFLVLVFPEEKLRVIRDEQKKKGGPG